MVLEQRSEDSESEQWRYLGKGVQAEGIASAKAQKQGRVCHAVMKEQHESQSDLSIMSGEREASIRTVQSDR